MTLRRTAGILIVLGLIGSSPLVAQRPKPTAKPTAGVPLPIPGRSLVATRQGIVAASQNGVHFGASEPRHDGAAIPEAAPIFGAPAPSVQNSVSRSNP